MIFMVLLNNINKILPIKFLIKYKMDYHIFSKKIFKIKKIKKI
jgi:hypothetical protein